MDYSKLIPHKPKKKVKNKADLTKIVASCEKKVKNPPKLKQDTIFQIPKSK